MAVQPIRSTSSNMGSTQVNYAATPDGGLVPTVRVTNKIVGDKELEMTFSASSTADISDLKIFPGIWRDADARELPEGVTFTCDGFDDDYAAMVEYFRGVTTNIYGVRIETTDVSNYQATLIFTEKDPTGQESKVKKTLSKYRVPVGNGYSETIELNEKDLNIVQWQGLETVLSKLKKSTSITFYFKVRGWNKTQIASALRADIIG